MKDPREMAFADLKVWLTDRFHMRGTASADLNSRRDESPYELPLNLWNEGTSEFREELQRVVIALVPEAAAEPWDPDAFNQLALLIEAGDIQKAVGVLEEITHKSQMLERKDGARLHMLALRTLLALGWTGTLDFWLSQKELVGTQWPGIIFKGLARQDIDTAFAHLPSLVRDVKTMREILGLLPGLMRSGRVGIVDLRHASHNILQALPPEAAALLREWFWFRNCPLAHGFSKTNPTLQVVLTLALDGDIAPRAVTAALVTHPPAALAAACP